MNRLLLKATIVDTHDDYSPWGECVVGFDDKKCLVVRYRLEDYEEKEESFEDAVMKPEEVWELARIMKVHVVDLPSALEKEFGEELNTCTSCDVHKVFQSVLGFLLDSHIRYRMVRKVIRKYDT